MKKKTAVDMAAMCACSHGLKQTSAINKLSKCYWCNNTLIKI